MLKNKKVIGITFIVITIFSFLIFTFKCKAIIKTNDKDNDMIFYNDNFLTYNIQRVRSEDKFLSNNVVAFTKKDIYKPNVLRVNSEEYIIFIRQKHLTIYSSKGKFIKDYSISKYMKDMYIKSSCIDDLNNDKIDEIILVTGKKKGKYGDNLLILTYNKNFNVLLKQSLDELNPWKVQTCDVDGDKSIEIAITVYKKTKFHPIMANRPFILKYEKNSIIPKWSGSRLSKPFEDLIFIDIDNDNKDEIASIELLKNGKKVINIYNWKGFGFEGLIQSRAFDDILLIRKKKEDMKKIYAQVRKDEDTYWIALLLKKNELIIKNLINM